MAWTEPKYSSTEIDNAGKQLASDPGDLSSHQFDILNNFRASHGFPLNTLQMRLRYHAHEIDSEAVVNQRLKRRQSITAKLGKMESLKLSKMQDIGGCRAVVQTVEDVDRLVAEFKIGRARHKLLKENDYVQKPKSSGYRSRHLVYAYESDRNPTFNGTRIEIQFRSQLQHIWAMAVETVGKMVGQQLKSGSGDSDYLRFFKLMSSWFSVEEGRPGVPHTPTSTDEIKLEMRKIDERVRVIETVRLYTVAVDAIVGVPSEISDGLFLIDLNTANRELNGRSFLRRDYSSTVQQHEEAFEAYRKLEQEYLEDTNRDVVLVSAEDVKSLQLAYPSYFGDMARFISWARRILDT